MSAQSKVSWKPCLGLPPYCTRAGRKACSLCEVGSVVPPSKGTAGLLQEVLPSDLAVGLVGSMEPTSLGRLLDCGQVGEAPAEVAFDPTLTAKQAMALHDLT